MDLKHFQSRRAGVPQGASSNESTVYRSFFDCFLNCWVFFFVRLLATYERAPC